jgi:hypothetical protein
VRALTSDCCGKSDTGTVPAALPSLFHNCLPPDPMRSPPQAAVLATFITFGLMLHDLPANRASVFGGWSSLSGALLDVFLLHIRIASYILRGQR